MNPWPSYAAVTVQIVRKRRAALPVRSMDLDVFKPDDDWVAVINAPWAKRAERRKHKFANDNRKGGDAAQS